MNFRLWRNIGKISREFKIGDWVKLVYPKGFLGEDTDVCCEYDKFLKPFKITKISICGVGPCEELGCNHKINGMCFGLNSRDDGCIYSLIKVGNINCPAIVIKDQNSD